MALKSILSNKNKSYAQINRFVIHKFYRTWEIPVYDLRIIGFSKTIRKTTKIIIS